MNDYSNAGLDSPDLALPGGPHGPEHEEWLSSVLAAGRSASDAAVRGQLGRCAECAREFHALFSVTQRIDREALLEKEILAEAHSTLPGEASQFVLRQQGQVDRFVRERLAAKPRRESAWKRSFTLRVAAAAATVAVATWIVKRLVPAGSRADTRITLGPSHQAILSPKGDVLDWGSFVWDFKPSGTEWYTVRIESAVPGDGDGELLFESDELYVQAWQPSDEVIAKWPYAIRWSVSAHAANRGTLDTSPAVYVRLVSSAR